MTACGIAGSPGTVAAFCLEQMRISQCNYLVGQFAFGDQTLDELESSVTLFAGEVMPKLAGRSSEPRNATQIPDDTTARGRHTG